MPGFLRFLGNLTPTESSFAFARAWTDRWVQGPVEHACTEWNRSDTQHFKDDEILLSIASSHSIDFKESSFGVTI